MFNNNNYTLFYLFVFYLVLNRVILCYNYLTKSIFLKITIVLSVFLVLEYEKTNTLPRNTNYF